MTRSCQAWLNELGSGSGPSYALASAELRNLLRRTLARAFSHHFGEQDLDDLTQDSLLRIHERLDSFEERSRFTTWAIAIAVNCAYAELRRRRHQHVTLESAMRRGAAALIQPEVAQNEPDREAALRDAIERALTERQRAAVLALLGGLPLAEIAERSGSTQGAIYKLLHDARRRLREHLQVHSEQALAEPSRKAGGA